MFALALGVWGLGLVSATALAYELGRTPTPRAPAVEMTAIHVDAPEVVRHAGWQPSVLTVPPITIVGHPIARPLAVTAPQKNELPDITRMNCAD